MLDSLVESKTKQDDISNRVAKVITQPEPS